jgi:chemotaxis protein methyltransferase CheR
VTQLKAFVEQLVPRIKEQKIRANDKSLRILSAGCSTGEEVHTLAMMLHDSGQFFWGWDVEVIGLDVDALALEKARRGLYFHNSFRGIPQEVLEKHFVSEGNGRVVKDSIRRMVKLRRGNLLDPESYAGLPRLDAVVCRNVLIYFSDEAMLRAVGLFGDALVPDGYMLLGHAESLARLTDTWTPIRFQGAVIYQSQRGGA